MIKEIKNKEMREKVISFFRLCNENPGIFSFKQAAEEVGLTYEKIRKYCASEEGYEDDAILVPAGYKCAIKVGRAINNKEMAKEKAEGHLIDNCYRPEYIEYFQQRAKEKDEKQERLEKWLATWQAQEAER